MSLIYLSVGALALARASLASAFEDFDADFANAAPAATYVVDSNEAMAAASSEASYVEAAATITSDMLEARKNTSPYPTSFATIPTNNAEYSAWSHSQHLAFCSSAKTTAPGYSRACVDMIWDSLYGRSVAPEDESMAASASATATTDSAVPPHGITAAPSIAKRAKQGEVQYVPSAKFYKIPADPERSSAFTASLDTKCNASSSDYAYVCSIWSAQKPTLATTTAAAAKRDEEQQQQQQVTSAAASGALAQPVETTVVAEDVDSGEAWEHFNFNRNVYLSSLLSACPTATNDVVASKCSAISSWYAEQAMAVATEAPAMPESGLGESEPTTFAKVTRSRAVEDDAALEYVEDDAAAELDEQ